jgi:hypothetical protein
LEEIDDEADEHGIHLVTTEEVELAKRYGIKTFPTLAFFRNQDPLIYKGELRFLFKEIHHTYVRLFIFLIEQVKLATKRKYWLGLRIKAIWNWRTKSRKLTRRCSKNLLGHLLMSSRSFVINCDTI